MGATCEDQMEHPHPFLKIKTPEENPIVMMTILPDEAEEKAASHHGFGRGRGHGPHGRGGHGGCFGMGRGGGGPRKWIKILRQFMKKKGVTAEDIHEMSRQAGANIPLEVIKKKMQKMDSSKPAEKGGVEHPNIL